MPKSPAKTVTKKAAKKAKNSAKVKFGLGWAPSWYQKMVADFEEGQLRLEDNTKWTFNLEPMRPVFESGGTLEALCEFIENPQTPPFHPFIWRLLWSISAERYVGSNMPNVQYEAGTDTLQKILQSWMKGVLPGYTLNPPGKKGPPITASEKDSRSGIADDYDDLLGYLQKNQNLDEIRKEFVDRGRKVDPVLGKLKNFISTIWDDKNFTIFRWLLPPSNLFNPGSSPCIVFTPPLTDADALSIAKKALEMAGQKQDGRGALREHLTYQILAHVYKRKTSAIKHIVETEKPLPRIKRKPQTK